jgi:RNA polymerase sigma-70 factor (ECF subfamily)
MPGPMGTAVRDRARTTSCRSPTPPNWKDGRLTWAPAGAPDAAQRELLARYIAAHEQADPDALIELLREDVRLTIEPGVGEWTGRPSVAQALREGMNSLGRWRMLATAANGRPAAGAYVLAAGDTAFRPFGLVVLTVEAGKLAAIDTFEDSGLFTAFGLLASLDS